MKETDSGYSESQLPEQKPPQKPVPRQGNLKLTDELLETQYTQL